MMTSMKWMLLKFNKSVETNAFCLRGNISPWKALRVDRLKCKGRPIALSTFSKHAMLKFITYRMLMIVSLVLLILQLQRFICNRILNIQLLID